MNIEKSNQKTKETKFKLKELMKENEISTISESIILNNLNISRNYYLEKSVFGTVENNKKTIRYVNKLRKIKEKIPNIFDTNKDK